MAGASAVGESSWQRLREPNCRSVSARSSRLLILPALGAVIAFSYYENARNLTNVSQRFIDRARDDAVDMASNFLEPVAATIRLVAAVAAARPEFFRTEESRNTLYEALISAPQIDAVYTSFDDGYHRVVTRMDEDRRRSDPRIPARANWHSSYIDDYASGAQRARHRRFFEKWPEPIGGYTEPSKADVPAMAQYQGARQNVGLAITDPIINPDTGYPVISIGLPDPRRRPVRRCGVGEYHTRRVVQISGYAQG